MTTHTHTQAVLAALASYDVALHEARKNQAEQTRKLLDKQILLYQPRLARLFYRQGIAVVKATQKYASQFTESLLDDLDTLFDKATLDTSSSMHELLLDMIKKAMSQGMRQMIATFKPDLAFSLTDPLAVQYIRDHGGSLITGIDDTSKEQIRNIIETAIENGTSYSELARQLKVKYTQFAIGVPQKHLRSRAELIAVTELGNAYCVGNHIEALSIQDNGIPMQKAWHTSGDDKVSKGCIANQQAGWIDLTDNFPSGHEHPLRFPGCRCVAMYRRKQ